MLELRLPFNYLCIIIMQAKDCEISVCVLIYTLVNEHL